MMIIKKNNKLIQKQMIIKEQKRIARQDKAMAIIISGVQVETIDSDVLAMVATKVCGPLSEMAMVNLRNAYRARCEFQVRIALDQIDVDSIDFILG